MEPPRWTSESGYLLRSQGGLTPAQVRAGHRGDGCGSEKETICAEPAEGIQVLSRSPLVVSLYTHLFNALS